MHSAQNFGANNFVVTTFFRAGSKFGFFVMDFIFFYMRWPLFFLHAVGIVFLHTVAIENGPRDINTEIVTKMVAVRAVDLSI